MSEKDWEWKDVERLIGDLDRDGFDVETVRTNANPVSKEKRLIIDMRDTNE